jgi:hypothetical protein
MAASLCVAQRHHFGMSPTDLLSAALADYLALGIY